MRAARTSHKGPHGRPNAILSIIPRTAYTTRRAATRWWFALAVALLLTTRSTDVGQVLRGRTGTGHELTEACTLYFEFLGRTGAGRDETFERDPFGMGYCAGLVRGVASASPETVCLPAGLTSAQAVWAVVQYLGDHAASLYEADGTLVLHALRAAFPCR